MNFLKSLKKFPNQKIAVIGDVFLDRFRWGIIDRVNPEQPASPLVKIIEETSVLGGASNVANNVSCFGAKCDLYGIIGRDLEGKKIKNLCYESRIKPSLFEREEPTIIKERVMAHGQQVVRIDVGEANPSRIGKELEDRIIDVLEKRLDTYNFVIMSDYDKGMFDEKFSRKMINLANSKNIPTLADPKPQNISCFYGCTVIRPNKREAAMITGINYENGERTLEKMAKILIKKTNSKYAVITCGEDGVFCYNQEKRKSLMIKTKAKEVADVTGAGDTFVATLALGLASGLEIFRASELANYASGLVVEMVGTATTNIEELKKRLQEDRKI